MDTKEAIGKLRYIKDHTDSYDLWLETIIKFIEKQGRHIRDLKFEKSSRMSGSDVLKLVGEKLELKQKVEDKDNYITHQQCSIRHSKRVIDLKAEKIAELHKDLEFCNSQYRLQEGLCRELKSQNDTQASTIRAYHNGEFTPIRGDKPRTIHVEPGDKIISPDGTEATFVKWGLM